MSQRDALPALIPAHRYDANRSDATDRVAFIRHLSSTRPYLFNIKVGMFSEFVLRNARSYFRSVERSTIALIRGMATAPSRISSLAPSLHRPSGSTAALPNVIPVLLSPDGAISRRAMPVFIPNSLIERCVSCKLSLFTMTTELGLPPEPRTYVVMFMP